MEKPVCKYGGSCYRKNPDHLKKFSHPRKEDKQDDDSSDSDLPPTKKAKLNSEDDNAVSVQHSSSASGSTKVSVRSAECLLTEDPKDAIHRQFLVNMPEDFYLFWSFCKSLNPRNPSIALKPALGLELVGAYDVLAGRLKGVPWESCVLHSRDFYDPPELSTVLAARSDGDYSSNDSGFHMGFFKDEPNGDTYLLVSNDSDKGCELRIEGSNIFSAVREYIGRRLQDKGLEESATKSLKVLDSQLRKHMSTIKCHLTCESVEDLKKKRRREVVADTFNKLGILVPYDKKTELGYRPLPVTNKELLKLLNKISSCSGSDAERDRVFEPLQEIVTFVQFANDECDYGMGLELGMDLFCHGHSTYHRIVEHLLPLAYNLLQRESYAKIIKEHLKQRNRPPLNFTTH